MNFDLDKITRKNIRDLVPYSSARDEFSGKGSIYLDANENPFNSPYNRYPDPHQKDLKKKIEALFSIPANNIFLGNGSDEAIDLLFRVFCEPGKENAISMSPSYGMYQVCASVNNIETRNVLLNDDYSLDPQKILDSVDANTRLVFLCSPNNPTANLLNVSDIQEILKGFEGIVVVDEAYIDFSGSEGILPFLGDYPNLVVLRTFSKAWGLAGIRLGMAFASEDIIRLLTRVKYPYNVNILTQEHAMRVIGKTQQKDQWISEIIMERDEMIDKLKKLQIVEKVYPSDANFLLVRFKDPENLYLYLKNKGIIVRDRSRIVLCEGALRITVGTKIENKLLLREIKRYISERKK